MTFLSQREVRDIVEKNGIPIVKEKVVKTKQEALQFAGKIGYPIVLKLVSSQVSHKTEVSGVVVNIRNKQQLEDEYTRMEERMREQKIKTEGYFVQEYVHGYEMIVGGKQDPQFGPVVLEEYLQKFCRTKQ